MRDAGRSQFNMRVNTLTLSWRMRQHLRSQWHLLMGIIALSLLSPLLALLAPLPLKIAVDHVIGDHPLPPFLNVVVPVSVIPSRGALLVFAVALLIAVGFLSQLRDLAASLLTTYTGENLVRGLRAAMLRRAQRLAVSTHDARGPGEVSSRIQCDAEAIQNLMTEGIIPFATSALTLAAMIYVTSRLYWPFSVAALALLPVALPGSRDFRRWLRNQGRMVKALEDSAFSVVNETLGAARVVTGFCQEDREKDRFISKANAATRARLRLALAEGGFLVFAAVMAAIGMAAVLWIGVRGIQSGTLTLGDLLLVAGYMAMLPGPLRTLNRSAGLIELNMPGATRALSLMDEVQDVQEHANVRPLRRALGAVTFRDVSLAREDDQPILQNFGFEVEAGACLGITGASGEVRTALVNLLTRIDDPTAGQILLDGLDLREVRLSDLRNQFAIVTREPVLFSTSVADNIAYARPGATGSQIVAAARAAHAHDFIVRLPQGYHTLVGECGLRLSDGERQRMCLARAFLKDAPILILDEPVRSDDVKEEAAIAEAVASLIHGRTTFLLADRASTLRHCHGILKIDLDHVIGVETAEAGQSASQPIPEIALAAQAPHEGEAVTNPPAKSASHCAARCPPLIAVADGGPVAACGAMERHGTG
jgi:ATP-binding cassette subfamily B protein